MAGERVGTRILICGFGSIGRRHFRHFKALGCEAVDVYRTGRGTMADDPALRPDATYHNLEEALAAGPDLVVVANPTSMHAETALAALDAGANLLVEKPLAHTMEDGRRIAARAVERGAAVGVAQNLRFHPHLQTLRGWVRDGGPLGEVVMARAHCGSYLPSWHPWEDYRRSYAARHELGGGRRADQHPRDRRGAVAAGPGGGPCGPQRRAPPARVGRRRGFGLRAPPSGRSGLGRDPELRGEPAPPHSRPRRHGRERATRPAGRHLDGFRTRCVRPGPPAAGGFRLRPHLPRPGRGDARRSRRRVPATSQPSTRRCTRSRWRSQ